MAHPNRIIGRTFHPLRDSVFVSDLERGELLSRAGLIIPNDNGKDRGIRNRWGRVHSMGPDVDDLAIGDWVLVKHGRWTPGIDLELEDGNVRVYRIEYPDAILVVADSDPRENLPNIA